MTGFAFTGSFCTMGAALGAMERLCSEGIEILPIMSENAFSRDTRFHKASDFVTRVEDITKKRVIHTIEDAEPLGPRTPLDALIVAPCTGNTLAKVAQGITDTAVTMAIKAHLRQDRPLIIALASNDAMSQNLANIARLLLRKSVYFVPMAEDDPERQPHSLVADISRIGETYRAALSGKQLRPLFYN